MSLAIEVSNNKQQARNAAWADYLALLKRESTPEPGDADLLEAALSGLDRTIEHFNADVQRLNRMRDLHANREANSPAAMAQRQAAEATAREPVEQEIRQAIGERLKTADARALLYTYSLITVGDEKAFIQEQRWGRRLAEVMSFARLPETAWREGAELTELQRQYPYLVDLV